MRTTGKCKNSKPPTPPSEPNNPEGPEYEKNINTISMHGEKFTQKQVQLLLPLNNLEKTDPSEIERAYNSLFILFGFHKKMTLCHVNLVGLPERRLSFSCM